MTGETVEIQLGEIAVIFAVEVLRGFDLQEILGTVRSVGRERSWSCRSVLRYHMGSSNKKD